MDEPCGKSWQGDTDEDEYIMLLIQLVDQGLLLLPMRVILTARLVCKHWCKHIGCLLDQVTLPFEAWSGSSDDSITSAALQRSLQQAGTRLVGKAVIAADMFHDEDFREEEDVTTAAADADDAWVPPCCGQLCAGKRHHCGLLGKANMQYPKDGEQQEHEGCNYHNLAYQLGAKQQEQQQQQDNGLVEYGAAGQQQQQQQQQVQQVEQQAAQGNLPGHKLDKAQQQQQQVQGNNLRGHFTEHRPSVYTNTHHPAAAAAVAGTYAAAAAPGLIAAAAGSSAAAAGMSSLVQAASGTSARLAASEGSGVHAANGFAAPHPLQHLSASFPSAAKVTLLCRYRSSSTSERAAPSVDKLGRSMQMLGQLPKLHTLVLQGSLPRLMWQPLVASIQQQEQQTAAAAGQVQLTDAMQVDQQQLQLQPQMHCGLQQKLVCLNLAGCDLPTAKVLEALVGLPALRDLVLHASIKSPALQPDHLEALSTGTHLESLSLIIYQIGLGGSTRVQLNPLLELTNLRSLEVAYKGIFNDQRPHFRNQGNITTLQHLTSFATAGLASPIIPRPSLTALVSFSTVGNNRRLGANSLATISSCRSIKSLKIEAGRRGVAAVAAEHLHYIGAMKQLTSITLSLSKGSNPASESTQQLSQLQIPGLKQFSVGSGDHRLGFSTEQLQQLASQWPRLESLRLNSFSPLQGLAGFGAFTSLQSLSLKPGTGTGKLLFELQPALEPLQNLKRLHLDFKSALLLEHVEAVAAVCANRLQHLSINVRANAVNSKAMEHIAQLTCLTSLQLLGAFAKMFVGTNGTVCLSNMQSLRCLSVQAPEDAPASYRYGSLVSSLWRAIKDLTQLQELQVWLGPGSEGRSASEDLAKLVEANLYECSCYALDEPEKAAL